MPRSVRIRRNALLAGLASLLAAGSTVGAVLAGPSTASAAAGGPAGPGIGPREAAATAPTVTSTACITGTMPPLVMSWQAGEVVTGYGFENGLGDVTATGGASLTVTPDAAATGTGGLRVDGLTSRSAVSFLAGDGDRWGWFTITARIRVHAPATPASVILRPVPSSGGKAVIGTARVTPDGWTVVSASYRPGNQATNLCFGPSTRPSWTRVELSLVPDCGGADVPTSLDVDDVSAATTYASSADGTSTPPPPSPLPGCGTTSPPAPACQARYTVTGEWPGGAVAVLEIRNPTSTGRAHWTADWTYPDDQRAVTVWGVGPWTQTGRTVTAEAPSWAPLPAGGTVTLGLVAALPAGTAHASAPTAVTLDGAACDVVT